MNHTELLQQLINEHSYKSYLEIGYGQGDNFNAMSIDKKVAIDPEIGGNGDNIISVDSDVFFESLDGRAKFDMIFIDGLHHAEQVERDIVNAWQHLKKGGALVIHDVWPANEEMTRVPRETKVWTGDVFRAWAGLLEVYPGLKTDLIKDDYGIGVVYFDKDVKIEPGFTKHDLTFDEYTKE